MIVCTVTYQERADEIADLIEQRLGVRGRNLEAKLHRAGRLLPKSIRREGWVLAEATRLQASPKLARMVDDGAVQKAHAVLERYLKEIDSWDRRKGKIISFLSINAFNLLATAGFVVLVLRWRGYL